MDYETHTLQNVDINAGKWPVVCKAASSFFDSWRSCTCVDAPCADGVRNRMAWLLRDLGDLKGIGRSQGNHHLLVDSTEFKKFQPGYWKPQ